MKGVSLWINASDQKNNHFFCQSTYWFKNLLFKSNNYNNGLVWKTPSQFSIISESENNQNMCVSCNSKDIVTFQNNKYQHDLVILHFRETSY